MVGNLSLEARNTIQAIKANDVEKRAGLRGLPARWEEAGRCLGGGARGGCPPALGDSSGRLSVETQGI